MNIRTIFLTIVIVYLFGFLGHTLLLKKTVYGDGIFYFSWVKSMVVDHDANFTNEYNSFHANQPMTSGNVPGNKYTLGPALLWLPGYIQVHSIVRGRGTELPYQIVVGFSSLLYGLAGLVLMYLLLSTYFTKMVTMATLIGIAGATNALFYLSIDTVNSHAVSFFAVSLFLTFLFQKPKNWLLIGGALGLVGLMRTQDLVVGLLVLTFLQYKYILRFLAGLAIAFLPQLVAWQILYGKFWTSPYISGSEGFDFLHPHIAGVLFHPANGLVLWTPIILLGYVGYFMKKNNLPLKLMALILFLQLYLVASWSTWWQGASYSGRMFVGLLPLISFGLANFFSIFEQPKLRYHIIMFSVTLPLVVINVLMIVYFLLSH